jgi:peptidoglycan/LPS O-acetylase OafA/YrhL
MAQLSVSASPRPAPETRDENNINFLRLLFALMVIWAHSFAVLLAPGTGIGQVAVNGFFVLSGYLISGSWARKRSWREFLMARARRILPGWFTAIAVCTFIFAPLGSLDAAGTLHNAATTPWRLIPPLLLVQPAFPPTLQGVPVAGYLNASLWTLPYEFRLYLLVPLFGTAWLMACQTFRRRKVWWLPALLFALAYAFYVAKTLQLWAPPALPAFGDSRVWSVLFLKPTDWPRFATYFAAGAVFYVYRARLRPSLVPTLICLFFCLLMLMRVRALAPLWPLVTSYAVMSIALDARWPLPRIPRDFDISYGTYLYAWPIQQLLVHFLGAQINVYLLFVLSAIGAMAAGTLSWFLIERPFLKSRRAVVN